MGVNIEADTFELLKDGIRNWVGKNFGSQELDDPSWNINALALHLTDLINNRDRAVKSMTTLDLSVYLKDISDENRANIMSRIREKLERCGGSLTHISFSKETFNECINGESKGVVATMKADIPTFKTVLRGFERWLERQQCGHGTILRYNLRFGDGFCIW